MYGTQTETGLPFSADKMARGLEAGLRSWRPAEQYPLMRPHCDVTAVVIKRCLEQQGIPARLAATYEDPPAPHTKRYYHVLTVAETPDSVTIDGTHGQLLPRLFGQKGWLDKALAQRFEQSGVQCAAFASDDYEEAIQETMLAVFGPEADKELLDRAHTLYGDRWNPANFRPFVPNADTLWIADRVTPRTQDVLEMR